MLGKLASALLFSAVGSLALAAPPATPQSITYAIDNPLRPGAKAPACPVRSQVTDGCTFHSVAGETYAAWLPVEPGETWTAHGSADDSLTLQSGDRLQSADGHTYQVIRVLPNPAVNADATVTFDRISGQPGALKVTERRRIAVMIHPS